MLIRQITTVIVLFFVLVLLQLVGFYNYFGLALSLMRFDLIINFLLFLFLGFLSAKFIKDKRGGLIACTEFIAFSFIVKLILSSTISSEELLFGMDISFNLVSAFALSDIIYLVDIAVALIGGILLGNVTIKQNNT